MDFKKEEDMFRLNKKGLTLVETLVASAVITTIMLASIPPSVKLLQQKATETIAKEIIALQEAEKNYWIDKLNTQKQGEWADFSTLQSQGYIPSSWSGKNLFGYDYTISFSSPTAPTCSISTIIPKGLEGVIQTMCPNVSITTSDNNVIVSSTIPVPGQEPTMETLLHRTSNDPSLRIAEDVVGFKKAIILSDEISNESMNVNQTGDIYVKALKTSGRSPTGWLSQASFPADIKSWAIGLKIYTFLSDYGYDVYIPEDLPVSVIKCKNQTLPFTQFVSFPYFSKKYKQYSISSSKTWFWPLPNLDIQLQNNDMITIRFDHFAYGKGNFVWTFNFASPFSIIGGIIPETIREWSMTHYPTYVQILGNSLYFLKVDTSDGSINSNFTMWCYFLYNPS